MAPVQSQTLRAAESALGPPLRVPDFGVGAIAASSLASLCQPGSAGVRNLVDSHPTPTLTLTLTHTHPPPVSELLGERWSLCVCLLLAHVVMSHFL